VTEQPASARLVVAMAWALPVLATVGAASGHVLADALTPVGMVAGLVAWAGAYAVLFWHLEVRNAPLSGEDQHKQPVEVPRQRDVNRAWVKQAREAGATDVTVWFAPGEYDDAEEITVSIREALAVLAKHANDYHVDAVARKRGEDVTEYLSEYTGAGVN
jgi:hypothetical protein